jgi:hypothetical protein
MRRAFNLLPQPINEDTQVPVSHPAERLEDFLEEARDFVASLLGIVDGHLL